MSDAILPNWMRELREKQDAARINQQRAVEQRELRRRRLQMDGPSFWSNVITSLDYAVLKSREVFPGVHVELNDISDAHDPKHAYRVHVLGISYVDVRYTPGSDCLRLYDSTGREHKWLLNSTSDGLKCFHAGQPMTASETADAIIQPMIMRAVEQ